MKTQTVTVTFEIHSDKDTAHKTTVVYNNVDERQVLWLEKHLIQALANSNAEAALAFDPSEKG